MHKLRLRDASGSISGGILNAKRKGQPFPGGFNCPKANSAPPLWSAGRKLGVSLWGSGRRAEAGLKISAGSAADFAGRPAQALTRLPANHRGSTFGIDFPHRSNYIPEFTGMGAGKPRHHPKVGKTNKDNKSNHLLFYRRFTLTGARSGSCTPTGKVITRTMKFVPKLTHPCSQPWTGMTGDDKRRFCGQCRLHVHNLSAMSPAEQEAILKLPGRKCVAMLRKGNEIEVHSKALLLARGLAGRLRAAAAVIAMILPFGLSSCATPKSPKHSSDPCAPQQTSGPLRIDGKMVAGGIGPPPSFWSRLRDFFAK